MEVLASIGNTALVELGRVVPPGCAKIVVKLEYQNPTGSMKDRMAITAIGRAEADGRLKPGDTVVEYTGGSTGTSLAFVCAVRGYRIELVSSDAFSQEKLDHMLAYGASLTVLPWRPRGIDKQLFLDMIALARVRPDGRDVAFVARHRDLAATLPPRRCRHRRRAGRIAGTLRRIARCAQYRGRRNRLRSAAVG